MTLISKTGNLRDAYRGLQRIPQLSPCHVDQLMNERRHNYALRDQQIHTADGMIYFIKNQRPKLAITRGSENPVLHNLDEAFECLREGNVYRLKQHEVSPAINDSKTIIIDLFELNVPHDERIRHMAVAIPYFRIL